MLGRGSALCRRLPLFLIFLLNSTGNLRVLVSRPRKKPYTLGCFLVTDFMNDRTKQRFRSVASPMMKCESLVLFDVDVCYTHTQHVRLHHLENKKKLTQANSLHNRNSTLFLLSHLCRTHLSVFGVPPSRSACPQIHGNRRQ